MIDFSLYTKYQKELYGRETITVGNYGFMTYVIYEDKSAYVHGIYIDPQFRGLNAAKQLEDILIEKHDPKSVYCYVDMTTLNPEQSLGCMLKNGYKISSNSAGN